MISLQFISGNSNLSFWKRLHSLLFTLFITFFLIYINNVICNCGSDQFSCASGECVPIIYHCNNRIECSDKSDEINCPSIDSKSNYFKCDDQNYIDINFVCDNDYDCDNHSDELNCPPRNCTETEFTCKDKSKCIALKLRCDKTKDCPDGSDESDCAIVCTDEEFKCNDGKCIYKYWHCDSRSDCTDGSDELNCPINNCMNEFKCKSNNKCIPQIYVCDGSHDCQDKSDEENCTKSDFLTKCETHQFLCHDRSQCINSTYKCNSINNCNDGSDELNCLCSDNEFRCSDRCFPNSVRCNGIKECLDGLDEYNCTLSSTQKPIIKICSINEFKCENNRCIEKEKYCDHKDDCGDNSDELIGCDTNICQTNKHECSQNCHWQYNQEYTCSCKKGYRLMKDNKTCIDIDECQEIFGICSGHNCINTLGHYKCHCFDGYELYDHQSCRIKGLKPTSLIFANKRNIRLLKLSLNRLEFTNYSPIYEETYASDIDFNLKHNYIVYSNLGNLYIGRFNSTTLSFHHPSLLIKRDLGNVVSLSVDWIHDLIYWADDSFHTIEVVYAQNSSKSKILFKNVSEKVTSISIDIQYSLLFWTCEKSARIERSSQDGSDRKILLDTFKVSPNILAIDIVTKKLYWFLHLHHLLYSMDYNGRDQKIAQVQISQPAFIDIFAGYIFYSEPHNNAIMKIDLVQDSISHPEKIVDVESPIVLKIVNLAKQPSLDNKCLNSLCGELCLPSNSSTHPYTCVRTNGLVKNTTAISKEIDENNFPVKVTTETAKNIGDKQLINESQTTIVTHPVEGFPLDGDEDLAFMIIAICLTVVLFILTLLILIYRSYQRRGVTSMNFDNPVYRKTTEDHFVLEKSDEGVDSYTTVREPLNTPATNV